MISPERETRSPASTPPYRSPVPIPNVVHERIVRVLLCLLGMLWPAAVSADVIEVPAESSTIQEAVDAASEGDTILVAAGVYDDYRTRTLEGPTSSVEIAANVFLDKPVFLTSEDGAEDTVILGSGLGPVIACSLVQGGTVRGFTISGGSIDETKLDGGGGIYCEWSDLNISANIIEDNTAPFGGAIALFSGSTSEIRDNTIRGNVGEAYGGAIAISEGSVSIIEGNVFADNEASVNGGALFFTGTASIIVQGNTIVGNSAVAGSALFCRNGTNVTFSRNIVAFGVGNSAVFCDTLGTAIPCVLASTCNNFWSNGGNNLAGCPAGEGDIDADPLFCSYDTGDYTLCVFSPSVGVADDCGLRGALPAACWNCPAEARRLTWGLLKTRYR